MRKFFKILLVEDNEDDIFFMEEALNRLKYSVQMKTFKSGRRVLDYLLNPNNITDLIFLDINLPGKSGLLLLKEIKSDPFLRTIPVIIFSSSDHPDDVKNAYLAYANCYLLKPRVFSDFVRVIDRTLALWINCELSR